jgi:hypothetical protein
MPGLTSGEGHAGCNENVGLARTVPCRASATNEVRLACSRHSCGSPGMTLEINGWTASRATYSGDSYSADRRSPRRL